MEAFRITTAWTGVIYSLLKHHNVQGKHYSSVLSIGSYTCGCSLTKRSWRRKDAACMQSRRLHGITETQSKPPKAVSGLEGSAAPREARWMASHIQRLKSQRNHP